MSKRDMSFSVGRKLTLDKLCREIRIQTPSLVGNIYSGFNSITNEIETWQLVRLNKDYNKSLLKRIS